MVNGDVSAMTKYTTWTIRPFDLLNLQQANGHQGQQRATSDPKPSGNPIPVRVWEDAGVWHVQAEVPGVAASAVTTEFFQDRLTIQYDRPVPADSKVVTYDNLNYGQFQRVIRITDEIQFDGITARVENGLLTVTLPKSEASQPRKIVVSE